MATDEDLRALAARLYQRLNEGLVVPFKDCSSADFKPDYKGPLIEADGRIVPRDIPTKAEPVAVIRLMMNLGYIIKSRELAGLGDTIFELISKTSK